MFSVVCVCVGEGNFIPPKTFREYHVLCFLLCLCVGEGSIFIWGENHNFKNIQRILSVVVSVVCVCVWEKGVLTPPPSNGRISSCPVNVHLHACHLDKKQL